MANRPSNHAWPRIHETVSAASSTSWIIGSNAPPDPNVPVALPAAETGHGAADRCQVGEGLESLVADADQ